MPSALVANSQAAPVLRAPRPEFLRDTTARPARSQGQYSRQYLISGRAGQCLLQRVSVRIQYARGNCTLSSYRHTYYEYFQFHANDQTVVDLHDFHYARDGWRPAAITNLWRHHGFGDRALRTVPGDPTLSVTKSFLLAPGKVHGARPRQVAGGGSFGLLRAGPDGPANVRMTLSFPGAQPIAVTGLASTPAPFEVAGSGEFISRHGWRTTEHLRFHFATGSSSMAGDTNYHPQLLADRLSARA